MNWHRVLGLVALPILIWAGLYLFADLIVDAVSLNIRMLLP